MLRMIPMVINLNRKEEENYSGKVEIQWIKRKKKENMSVKAYFRGKLSENQMLETKSIK